MEGVRVLEIAQFTFVPAAGAVLADWGADVIKVEPTGGGDAQRGFTRLLGLQGGPSFAPIMEGPNRGKRSIALALDKPESQQILKDLVLSSDVLLTNYLPSVRKKLRITLDEVREINPKIVYVSGSGFGSEGDDADRGAYDATAFWARGGSADGRSCKLHACGGVRGLHRRDDHSRRGIGCPLRTNANGRNSFRRRLVARSRGVGNAAQCEPGLASR